MKLNKEYEDYLHEESLDFQTNGERGDSTLKCPSCGMIDFVHTNKCELSNIKKLL
ncbi:MAG: hypothetical protein WC536_00645 [Patescibacteria group bacterium]